ncbi:MAG: serine hydrolase, partial [Candidatus Aminicenantes bacterium]|nr:serine hydrolase [Candidatus Aminicenantes bacterium]
MVRKTTTLMLVFLAFFYLGRARNLEDRIHEYENFVEKQMKVDRVPGLSVAFMKGDYLWAKGFGYSDLENRVLASEVSSYRLASITKTMTA